MFYRRSSEKLQAHFKVLLMATVLFIVLVFMNSLASSAENEKQILFISSYNSRFPTFFLQIDGLKDELPSEHYIIDLEFMDAKRFNTDENVKSFYDRLKYKLSQRSEDPYDLVITSDDNALSFVMAHQNELFKETPIVFFGVNEKSLAVSTQENPFITGVFEQVSISDTLTLANTLIPSARKVYVIFDDTLAAQGDLDALNEIKNNFTSIDFEYLDLTKISFEEMTDALEQITSDAYILLLAAYDDVTGRTISFEDVLALLNQHAKVPVFHLYEHGVGGGLIGGDVISHYVQGKTAGSIVRQILELYYKPKEIPIIFNSPNIPLFDYTVFHSYGLDENLMPDNVKWVNKTLSFWDLYFNYIVAFICIIVSLLFFTSYLLYYIKKAKSIERKLIERTDELKDLYEELSASEEELRAQNENLMNTQSQLKQQKSELIRKQKLIEDYAYYDFLTHLPNRYSLKLDILKLLGNPSSSVIKGAILFIDFDNFKYVNDTYGHSVGDALLIEISRHIEKQLVDMGKVYRLGGDEFVAMIDTSCDYETVEFVAQKLLHSFELPLVVNATPFFITFSMGIALFPLHGNDFDSLIGSADMAMYAAKNAGKNRYQFFDENTKTKADQMQNLQAELMQAVNAKALTLNYQPIYNHSGHMIKMVEAMIRWKSSIGLISPSKFLPMAHELGIMNQISRCVFEEAFDLLNILKSGDQEVAITINISNQELANSILASDIEQLLSKTHADPTMICLEVSESLVEENFETIQHQIVKLHDLGFKIIIDNMGAEYISLNYLKKLPIDYVKMDISLFRDYAANPNILNSLISIIRDMNLQIIIKNIESDVHMTYLDNIDFDFMQGHIFSFPVDKYHIQKMILDEDIKIYHPQVH